ncbi:hypothetical protein AC579_9810 [Pseudocercospora musae]|uniref:Uncharacterized protein n=1 Tax=Pseudocercospora musae TaxID=113226 RepID=A0A139IV33_9PEZI|nr:hypothetical protein AC579_9810 [Pseudocercospora musae]
MRVVEGSELTARAFKYKNLESNFRSYLTACKSSLDTIGRRSRPQINSECRSLDSGIASQDLSSVALKFSHEISRTIE